MNKEISTLLQNQTWEITECPPNKQVIRIMWIFMYKRDEKGIVYAYKARLVAIGSQQDTSTYSEIHAPTPAWLLIRLFFHLCSLNNLVPNHLDIKNAFLNGELEDEVYTEQPLYYELTPNNYHQVCQLKKSLYSLRQAPHVWFLEIDRQFRNMLFTPYPNVEGLYIRKDLDNNGVEHVIYLLFYVDDIFVASADAALKAKVKNQLREKYRVKDIGEIH